MSSTATTALEHASPSDSAETRALRRWAPNVWAEVFDDDREALADFRDEMNARGFAPTTLRNYDSILRAAAQHMNLPLLNATVQDIRRYLGRGSDEGQDRVKPATRNTNRAVLNAFYRFAVDEGLLEQNPVNRVGRSKAVRGTPRPFTKDQVTAMLTCGAYARTRAMILLGYYQGFRVSQIARVHGKDIDIAAGRITTVGKGNKQRTLPLHPVIAELALTMPSDDWWFPARRDRSGHVRPGPIRGGSVSDLIRKAMIRADITDPRLSPHSLRHSFGTELVEAGVDIRVIQELMMHEQLTSTQIYTGVSESIMSRGIQTLASRDVPAQSGRRRNPTSS